MKFDTIGQFIKERRKELKLSQKDLADLLCLTPQAISFYENDSVRVPLDAYGPLSVVLKVSLNSLFDLNIENVAEEKEPKFSQSDFSAFLSYLREQKQVTLKVVCSVTGISMKKLSNYENNHQLPSVNDFVTLAKYYNVSYENLYYCKKETLEDKTELPVIDTPVVSTSAIAETKKTNNMTLRIVLISIITCLVIIAILFIIYYAIVNADVGDTPTFESADVIGGNK